MRSRTSFGREGPGHGGKKDHKDEGLRLINNRQGGRRRGRGGGPRSPNNVPNAGNRQDNRSRGNAAQLHEKYKAMARDAQLSGDRVQTEYFLQFADHYYRVLNENRARFEEQRPRRDDYSYEDEDQDDAHASDDGDEQERRPERGDRPARRPREQHRGEQDRGEQDRGERAPRRQAEAEGDGDEAQEERAAEPRARRPRTRRDREAGSANGEEQERISLDVLPPAIASVADGDEAPKAPRRRTRRPREGEEIAPAA